MGPLGPLADRLTERIRQEGVRHADETPVQPLDPGAGKTRRGYLWSYRSNDLDHGPPMVVFDYQTSRSGQHAMRFLEDWTGALMEDDTGGYTALFRQSITEWACLAWRQFPGMPKAATRWPKRPWPASQSSM